MNKKNLWLALRAYHFNHIVETHLWDRITEKFGDTDASTKAFAEKLARKLGWTKAFALRAISEYKKFVYLAVTADFSVTPSKIIDQVWHEHLLFTKGYRDFCNDIIGYQLDHSPELIPMDSQTGTFNAQYMATLEFYKTEFRMSAPEEIWGTPKFDIEKLSKEEYQPKKKRKDSKNSNTNDYTNDDTPLYMYFDQGREKDFLFGLLL